MLDKRSDCLWEMLDMQNNEKTTEKLKVTLVSASSQISAKCEFFLI